ncbi:hypothetical protein GR11A_00010 [Vibrio phage vB_VcorM_GR11A]|nr:hypothetical protein GR11A_00010 [Vibrio phage vB_VcorM_GR11A]
MKITLDSKSLLQAIKTVKATTGNNNAVISIKKEGKTSSVVCSATGKEKSIEVVVTGTIESGSGLTEFGFDTGILTGLLRGRKEMSLTFGEAKDGGKKKKKDVDDSQVFFETKATNGRKYDGNFCVIPGEDIVFNDEDSEKDMELNKDIQSLLTSAIDKVGITDIFEGNDLELWVRANKKGMTVACFDAYHVALCQYPDIKVKDPLEFNLPYETFSAINELAEGEAFDVKVGASTISASNEFFRIVMPLLQSNDMEQTIDDVIEFVGDLNPSKADAGFKISLSDLETTLANVNSVHEDGVGCELIFEKKDVKFSLKTSYGEVNDHPPVDEVSGKKGTTVVVNQHLFEDCLNAYPSKDNVDVKIQGEDLLWFQSTTEKYTATYITQLLG